MYSGLYISFFKSWAANKFGWFDPCGMPSPIQSPIREESLWREHGLQVFWCEQGPFHNLPSRDVPSGERLRGVAGIETRTWEPCPFANVGLPGWVGWRANNILLAVLDESCWLKMWWYLSCSYVDNVAVFFDATFKMLPVLLLRWRCCLSCSCVDRVAICFCCYVGDVVCFVATSTMVLVLILHGCCCLFLLTNWVAMFLVLLFALVATLKMLPALLLRSICCLSADMMEHCNICHQFTFIENLLSSQSRNLWDVAVTKRTLSTRCCGCRRGKRNTETLLISSMVREEMKCD